MNIFDKRPLSLILCIMLGGFVIFSYSNELIRAILVIISLAIFFIPRFSHFELGRQRFLSIISIVLIISSFLSYIYFDLWFKAYDRFDDEVKVEATIVETKRENSYSTRYTVKCNKVDDKYFTGYKFYMYLEYKDYNHLKTGAKIKLNATISNSENEQINRFNISKGINGYLNNPENIEIIDYSKFTLNQEFEYLREYLSRYAMMLSDADAGALLSALLVGERDKLSDNLRLNFKLIGISHTLALSGMHLSILSLGLDKLLYLLRVKRKMRVALSTLFVIGYMTLTGFSVSVVRAGLMFILSSLLYLLSKTKDSLTNLCIAVGLICTITPYAIYDVALWLSALATFGIVVLGEHLASHKPTEKARQNVLAWIKIGLLSSVFAISATLLVSVLTFGGISVVAPFTTLIFSILIEAIMYLGCLMLILGSIIPIGRLLIPLCKLVTNLSDNIASFDNVYVDAGGFITISLVVLLTVFFYSITILNIKNFKKTIIIFVISFITVFTVPFANSFVPKDDAILYSSSDKRDLFVIISDNQTCLINSSQYSKSVAYDSLDLLSNLGLQRLDKYFVTHYAARLEEDFNILLSNLKIDTIFIPEPRNKDEERILKILYKTAEDFKTEITIVNESAPFDVGSCVLNLLYSEPYGKTSMNSFTIKKNDEIYTYISSGLLSGKTAEQFNEHISNTNHLILGNHGKKYKEKIYLDECFSKLETLIINSEKLFLVQSNMQYYIDNGCKIYSHSKEPIYLLN